MKNIDILRGAMFPGKDGMEVGAVVARKAMARHERRQVAGPRTGGGRRIAVVDVGGVESGLRVAGRVRGARGVIGAVSSPRQPIICATDEHHGYLRSSPTHGLTAVKP